MRKDEAMKLIGPTGDYPGGKLNDSDRGGLMAAIGIEDDKIVIEFGTKLDWIAMTREEAVLFAMMLIEKANELPPLAERVDG